MNLVTNVGYFHLGTYDLTFNPTLLTTINNSRSTYMPDMLKECIYGKTRMALINANFVFLYSFSFLHYFDLKILVNMKLVVS